MAISDYAIGIKRHRGKQWDGVMIKPLKRDKSIRSFLEKRLPHFGLSGYCYFLFSKYSGKATAVISNYPREWMDEYIESEYYLTDPVILHAKQTIVPFYLARA